MGGFSILGALDLVQDLVSLVDPGADLLLPGTFGRPGSAGHTHGTA